LGWLRTGLGTVCRGASKGLDAGGVELSGGWPCCWREPRLASARQARHALTHRFPNAFFRQVRPFADPARPRPASQLVATCPGRPPLKCPSTHSTQLPTSNRQPTTAGEDGFNRGCAAAAARPRARRLFPGRAAAADGRPARGGRAGGLLRRGAVLFMLCFGGLGNIWWASHVAVGGLWWALVGFACGHWWALVGFGGLRVL
jgi:hypothetical protein